MLQDLSASVFFPPCSQHRTLGVYPILRKSMALKEIFGGFEDLKKCFLFVTIM